MVAAEEIESNLESGKAALEEASAKSSKSLSIGGNGSCCGVRVRTAPV